MKETCACGSEKRYDQCCGRFIEGKEIPKTPEELMRSRYTAYTLVNLDYVKDTMVSPAADDFDEKAIREWSNGVEWKELEIIRSSEEGDTGLVEFHALFTEQGEMQGVHELSQFRRENGRWFYVDGEDPCDHEHGHHHEHPQTPAVSDRKANRNDACPCGSGKKYKKCCLN